MASSRPQKERVSVISFGFEGTEIKGYSHGYGKHHRFQPEGIEHQEDAMQGGEPQQAQGEDLGTQRDGARLTEIADIRSQQLVVQQPLVGSRRTAEKEGGRKQQKGRGGQYGQENTGHTQCQRQESDGEVNVFHGAKIQGKRHTAGRSLVNNLKIGGAAKKKACRKRKFSSLRWYAP